MQKIASAPFPPLPPASGVKSKVPMTTAESLRVLKGAVAIGLFDQDPRAMGKFLDEALLTLEGGSPRTPEKREEIIFALAKRMDGMCCAFRALAGEQPSGSAERVYFEELAEEHWRVHELLHELFA